MKKLDAKLFKSGLRQHRKQVFIGLAVLILIIAGVIWYGVAHRASTARSDITQLTGQQLIDEVNKRYGAHDYVGAIRLIEGQRTIADTSTQILLAGAYANSGDNTRALQIYDTLESRSKLSELDAATAGELAERTKDYQKAIAYFKKAKERADPNAPDQIAVYAYRITILEKK